MIVTVTPNPSLDRTLQVERLEPGAVNRVTATRTDPGGKGVNVATALRVAGVATRCVVPWGGEDGATLRRLLQRAELDVVDVALTGDTRVNLSLAEADGIVTKLNQPGPLLTADEVDALLDAVATAAVGAAWVVSAGSLPPGAPDDLHARIVQLGHAAGARVAVDAAGPGLLAALAAGPDLVKPNRDELADAVGTPVATIADAVAAAEVLRSRGVAAVLASLGADGAVLVDGDTPLHAHAPVATPRSSVGAGDAALAGFLAGQRGETRAQALCRAVAYGAAAVQLPGTRMPGPHHLDLDAVSLTDRLGPDRPLAAAPAAGTVDATDGPKGEHP